METRAVVYGLPLCTHRNRAFSLFYEQQLREHFNRCGIYEAILVIYLYITGLWRVGGISQGK